MNFNSLLETEIQKATKWMYSYLKSNLGETQFKIFHPMPSPIDKIQNRIRFRMIIKGNITQQANHILNKALKEIYNQNFKMTKVSIDINPNNMF